MQQDRLRRMEEAEAREYNQFLEHGQKPRVIPKNLKSSHYKPLSPITSFLSGYPGSPSGNSSSKAGTPLTPSPHLDASSEDAGTDPVAPSTPCIQSSPLSACDSFSYISTTIVTPNGTSNTSGFMNNVGEELDQHIKRSSEAQLLHGMLTSAASKTYLNTTKRKTGRNDMSRGHQATNYEDEIIWLPNTVHSEKHTVNERVQEINRTCHPASTVTKTHQQADGLKPNEAQSNDLDVLNKAKSTRSTRRTHAKKIRRKKKSIKQKRSKEAVMNKLGMTTPTSEQTLVSSFDSVRGVKKRKGSDFSFDFNKGKTGVFERLWNGKKTHQKKKVGNKSSVCTNAHSSISKSITQRKKVYRAFKKSELSELPHLYTMCARFSLALSSERGEHCKSQIRQEKSRFWISEDTDAIPHKYTISAAELARCDRHGDEHDDIHIALEIFLPRILSYLPIEDCVAVGATSQHCLILSHSTHVSANRGQYLLRFLEPAARCWKIIVDDLHLIQNATARLLREVHPNSMMELRRLMQPSPALIDVIMTLGALLCSDEPPWRHVKLDPIIHRRMRKFKRGSAVSPPKLHLDKPSLVGATWRDCQKIVMHVETDGHLLSLLQRMAMFNPEQMSQRSLSNIRSIIKSGILLPENAKRGGKIGIEVARWIKDSVKRALAMHDMMQMGQSLALRKSVASARLTISEARWHTEVRQKLNDGFFIAFFGWT